MNETAKAFSDAFVAYVNAKRKLVKENVPYYILVNPNYLNTFLEQRKKEHGSVNFTFSYDGEYSIEVEFLNETYEVSLVLDSKVETYKEIYQD